MERQFSLLSAWCMQAEVHATGFPVRRNDPGLCKLKPESAQAANAQPKTGGQDVTTDGCRKHSERRMAHSSFVLGQE